VQTWFADRGTPEMFNWYVIALLVVSVAALVTIPETRGRDLKTAA